MRVLLAVSDPEIKQEVVSPTDMSLFNTMPSHPLRGLAGLEPLSENEIEGKNPLPPNPADGARVQARKDLDEAGDATGVPHLSQDLFAGKLRISEETQRKILGELKRKRLDHYGDYLAILQRTPLLGFISHVNLDDPRSPTAAEIAAAFGKVATHLHGYRKDLEKGHGAHDSGCQDTPLADGSVLPCVTTNSIDWSEYLAYSDVIGPYITAHPQYCQQLDELKTEAEHQRLRQQVRSVALGVTAGFVAGATGGLAIPVGLALGGAVGSLVAYDAQHRYDQVLARNLALALDDPKTADFLELIEAQKQLGMSEFFIPLSAIGTTPLFTIGGGNLRVIAKGFTGMGSGVKMAAQAASEAQGIKQTLVGVTNGAKSATAAGGTMLGHLSHNNSTTLIATGMREATLSAEAFRLIQSRLKVATERFGHNATMIRLLNSGPSVPRKLYATGRFKDDPQDGIQVRTIQLLKAPNGTWMANDPRLPAPLPIREWLKQMSEIDENHSLQIDLEPLPQPIDSR
jgi:hypothetical protein